MEARGSTPIAFGPVPSRRLGQSPSRVACSRSASAASGSTSSPLGLRIAVISNGSPCWQQEVRAALGRADWVSLKVDTVEEATWHRLNRPEPSLELGTVLDGMSEASRGGGESEGVEA